VFYTGPVKKGKHTAYLRGPNANTWGCQDQWGDLDIVVMPAKLKLPKACTNCVAAYQTPDSRRGCPPSARANSPLIQRDFYAASDSVVIVQGHLIRNAQGRRDLLLYVDNRFKDRTLTFTSQRQWEDASVFWSGPLGKGSHNARLQGPNANTWGCQDQWGDLDITVIPASSGAVAWNTPDNRRGCPPGARAGWALIKRDINLAATSVVMATGHLIRQAPGRRDLHLMVDGKLRDRTLTYSSSRQWEDATVFWSGTLGKGKHSLYLNSPQANTWGCQDSWGDLDITAIPTSSGVKVYQTNDGRGGCPPRTGANKPLISKTFTVGVDSIAMITGHIIRLAPGRRDLHLILDGRLRDRTLTFTRSRQWEDAAVFYSGPVKKGKHTAYLRGPNANTWGCGKDWGDLDIVTIPVKVKASKVAGSSPPPPPYKAPAPPPYKCQKAGPVPPPPPGADKWIWSYQTPDLRGGCPPNAGVNYPLVKKDFSVATDSVVVVQGHLIRNSAGRKDLHLKIDCSLKDRSLTFTRSRQWEDTTVYWVGPVKKGKHSAYLTSPQANT